MKAFHHALKFRYDVCIGCSHCTGVCPTGAIHIEGGRPILNPNRCIDCGMCYQACPASAISIEQDDFQTIFNYKYPVILLPSIFSAQFPSRVNHRAILSALYHLGFKYVHEVEESVDIIKEVIINRLNNSEIVKPVISTFCPAVVRLIQVKYPSLIPNLLHIKPPLDLTALYIKKKLINEGVQATDIGIFYLSPCAAKIAAIKSSAEDEKSPIDGVINMNYLFNKVFRIIKQRECKLLDEGNDFVPLTQDSVYWALTGGEAGVIPTGRNLAIDEIHNVRDFLEKIENEEIKNVDFLELRACDESCPGGILCSSNRFVTAERQKKRAVNSLDCVPSSDNDVNSMKDFLLENITLQELDPMSIDKLDNNISVAMQKMQGMMKVNQSLPQVDCRICGYQTCKLFSEAVVNEQADLKQCVFVRMDMERAGNLTTDESLVIMKRVWGDKKMNFVKSNSEPSAE